jgi:hypothetical protein
MGGTCSRTSKITTQSQAKKQGLTQAKRGTSGDGSVPFFRGHAIKSADEVLPLVTVPRGNAYLPPLQHTHRGVPPPKLVWGCPRARMRTTLTSLHRLLHAPESPQTMLPRETNGI